MRAPLDLRPARSIRGQITNTHRHSRGTFCPSHALLVTPFRKKGRREDRAPAGTHKTPMRNDCTRMHRGDTGQPRRPAFPAQWFDGLCRALPGDEFLLPPSRSRNSPQARRLTRVRPSQKLDRSNDGQDHTVSPYASSPASPKGFAGNGAVRHAQFVTRSRGSSRPARPIPHRRRPRPPQPSPRFVTTYDRPFGGLGWPTHTTNPNFGKVECFCDGGLTAIWTVLPDRQLAIEASPLQHLRIAVFYRRWRTPCQ
jgi:hypothetical protein